MAELSYFDMKQAVVKKDDIANKKLIQKTNAKSMNLMYFTHTPNAMWAADRFLQALAFPSYELTIQVNRDAFQLKPGSLFLWSSTRYGESAVVMRVLNVEETDLESGEALTMHCIKDPSYIGQQALIYDANVFTGEGAATIIEADPFNYFDIIETPYAVAGDNIRITPLAAKVTGYENKFILYRSIDGGSSYTAIQVLNIFYPHGTLIHDYSGNRHRIDDKFGFWFDSSFDEDWDTVQTLTRNSMLSGNNYAILGDEIICFQTITPHDSIDGRYHVIGIWGGKFDTEIMDHVAGENFWFLGSTASMVADSSFLIDADLYFKGVPVTATTVGAIADATADNEVIDGRARSPYPPANLRANGEMDEIGPIYSEFVVLDWDARVRGAGAGSQLPTQPDDPGAIEGYFKVEVYVSSVKVRTVTGITAETWTYTSAMNIDDNGSFPAQIVFKVSNYITDGGVIYESAQQEITVDYVAQQWSWVHAVDYEIQVGSVVSGFLDYTYRQDDIEFVLAETTGTPGFTYDFTFENVPDAVSQYYFNLFGRYDGNPAHNVKGQIWNYSSEAFENITVDTTDFASGSTNSLVSLTLPATITNYVSSGQMIIRVTHTSAGNVTHEFHIDHMYLSK